MPGGSKEDYGPARREGAKQVWLHLNRVLSDAQIARALGITSRTLTNWKRDGAWTEVAKSTGMGLAQLEIFLLNQLAAMKDSLEEQGTGYFSSKDQDASIKLLKQLKMIGEMRANLVIVADIMTQFVVFAGNIKPELKKQIADIVQEFTAHKAEQADRY